MHIFVYMLRKSVEVENADKDIGESVLDKR